MNWSDLRSSYQLKHFDISAQFDGSPYAAAPDNRARPDLLQSEPLNSDGKLLEENYNSVNVAWFIEAMETSYEVTQDGMYLDYARINIDELLSRAEQTDTGTWFVYKYAHAPGGLDNGVPWVSGMAQGMGLSVVSRMYEITGENKYAEAAHDIFRTYSAPRIPGSYWFVNTTDCPTKTKCVYLEEYPSNQNDQNAHVVNGHIYSAWGLYDYYRVFDNQEARQLFIDSAQTLADSFDRYRRPGAPSWYAMRDFGYQTWGTPQNYHIGVTYQLSVLADMTGIAKFDEQAELLRQDCNQESCSGQ